MAGELADDPLPKGADDVVLLQRRKPDEHGDAIAEEGDEPVLPDLEGERRARQGVLRSSPATSSRSPRRSARAVLRRLGDGVSVEEAGSVIVMRLKEG